MSMNDFDPERAQRVVANANFGEGWHDYDVVASSDYDKLLSLYRGRLEDLNNMERD